MNTRFSLRWKILLLAALAPATLGAATFVTVSHNVTEHVNSSSLHESLEHSVAVFESMLRTRSRELAGSARVIAQDPRFFSLLMLEPSQRDSRFVETVRGMARDFNRIARTELFEVLDRRGAVLASVGPASTTRESRETLVRATLRDGSRQGVLVTSDAQYQVALTPVVADGRVVGVLLLGSQIGKDLARELRSQMRCDVTFLSGSLITGTTLSTREDRAALVQALARKELKTSPSAQRAPVQQIQVPNGAYLTVVRSIPESDPESLYPQIYVLQRSFDPETSFQRTMEKDLLLLGAVALVVALLTGFLFSDHILRPVQSLVQVAQEMERGNYDHPLEVERNDEIGYLTERFSDMRQRERAYLGSLEHVARVKSQFLSLASHELRTPISVLVGYSDLLANGALGPITGPQRKALDTMHQHLGRLTRLAEDAGRFADVKSERLVLEFQDLDVETLVTQAANTARAAGAGRSVEVETRCDPFSGPVEADPSSIEDAIVQLVTNAIRFTPDGGHVEVHAFELEGSLCVAVKDNGVGIDEGRLETLLSHGLLQTEIDRHRTPTGLEFNSTGLGLGLSIARSIVEAHGGRLRGMSRLGEGSTFFLEVPMRQAGDLHFAA
jgi:signal transduction histidine kinase